MSRSNLNYLVESGKVSIYKNVSREITLGYSLKSISSNVYTSTLTSTIQY